MVRRVFSAVKQDNVWIILAYLFTLSLAVVFVNWEATPYNPKYACIQTAEVFFILVPAFLLNCYAAHSLTDNGLLQLLFRLVVVFGSSVLIIRLNVEFTRYNVAFVLTRASRVFLLISVAMMIRLLFFRYQRKR